MGSLSTTEQRKLAYFHALGKSMTENTQEVYESRYKSSHNVRLNEIWSDTIYSAATFIDAQTQSYTNPAITLHEMVTLSPVGGSNGMAWYLNSGGTFVRPWVSPVDVPNPITNLPSDGFGVKLYTSTDIQIATTQGAWSIDYYSGMIHFGEGYTPTNMGWGNIKCTFFQYTGKFGVSGGTSGGGGGLLSTSNINMTARNTSYVSRLACDTGLTSVPLTGSTVAVFINGVQVNVGDLTTDDCYFSSDAGMTKKINGQEQLNDKLYWNYNLDQTPYIGYDLSITDKITFMYLV